MGEDKKKEVKGTAFVKVVRKRDGSIVPFDVERIVTAIFKAMVQTGEGTE